MLSKTFYSPAGFRQSLESRLKAFSKRNSVDLQRIRRKVAFERFLARLFLKPPHPWVLKGGYALEVRFELSRATKDLDLGTLLKITGSEDEKQSILLKKLQECAMLKLEDHFQFRIEPSDKLIKAAPYGGFRFPVRCMLAGRLFVAFSLDIGIGDVITPPIEEIVGGDWLDFCGMPPAKFEVISLEQQFAEKVHAVSIDRGSRENSRVKDLIDMLLLIDAGLKQERVMKCLENTFKRRGELSVPTCPPSIPDSWRNPFRQIAVDCGINPNFDAACNTLSLYWTLLLE